MANSAVPATADTAFHAAFQRKMYFFIMQPQLTQTGDQIGVHHGGAAHGREGAGRIDNGLVQQLRQQCYPAVRNDLAAKAGAINRQQ